MLRFSIKGMIQIIPIVLLLVAGCTVPPEFERYLPTPMSTIPQPESLSTDISGQLLIQRNDGNLYVMAPNGDERQLLTDDAGETRSYRQPTWAPSGEQIAWSGVELVEGEPQAALFTSDAEGQGKVETAVPFLPFYIYWSPDSQKLVYLSSWIKAAAPSMALRLFDVAGGAERATNITTGQPFYLSWSPDSQQILAHVENRRVERYAVDENLDEFEPIENSFAGFGAPQWTTNNEFLYAVSTENGQQLIRTDEEGNQLETITDYDGRISFTSSPNSQSLAYVITTGRARYAAFGPLYLFDFETKGTRELSEGPVLAFFWSPDSTKLAFLTAERVEESIQLRWRAWDGAKVQTFGALTPSRVFLEEYLPFFDQYAQSMSLWSPDSSAFAYPGANRAGLSGIWVQEVDEDKLPVRISDGVFVAWSPR